MRRTRTQRTLRSALLLAAVLLGAVAVGCSSDSDSSSDQGTTTTTTGTGDSVDGSWTLTSYLSQDAQIPAATTPATLDLVDAGTFTGSTGCNRIAGTWTGGADGGFTITAGPSTLMACADPGVEAQEQAVTAAFPQVTDVIIDGSTLMMDDAAGNALLTWSRG